MLFKKCVLTTVLSVTLLLSGTACGNADAPQSNSSSSATSIEPEQDNQSDNEAVFNFYRSYTSDIVLSLDQNGNEIPKEKQYTVLYDLITKKPQCQTRKKHEKIGEDPEYGYPITRTLTALFDMNGNMLFDYDEVEYSQGFDNFVIKSKLTNGFEVDWNLDYDERLVNFKTGEDVLKGVGWLEVLDREKKELVACTLAKRDIIGIIDENAKIISKPQQTDMKYNFPQIFEGIIIAEEYKEDLDENAKPDTKMVLFSRELEIIRSALQLGHGYGQLKGKYLKEMDFAGRQRIIDKDLNICYEYNTDGATYILQYFDGELALLNNRMGDGRVWSWELRDKSNNVIVEKYAELSPIEEFESDEPAKSFLGVKDNEIHLLNRKGEVLFAKKVDEIDTVSYIGNGLIVYGSYEDVGVLDMELNEVISRGKYADIYRRYSGIYGVNYGRKDDILVCAYFIDREKKTSRCDLLNSDLEVIMSGVSSVFDISEDRIAVERGFSRGLIDYDGNWVKECSIFGDFYLEDEYNGAYW